MTPTKLSLVNLTPSARPAVLAAAREAFPGVEVSEAGTIDSAARSAPDLLVLVEPDEVLVAGATQAVDADGLPRWAVVILGAGDSDLAESVPPEEWSPRSLARTFRSVQLQHGLLRENLRLRGDLKTVARRISHDLRTPAGCLHATTDLLNELAAGKGAALSGIVEIFRQSTTEISQLIDRVSFLIRASVDPPEPSAVEMGVEVAAVLRQLEREIREGGAAIAQPDSWPTISGVPAWLRTVWWNLLQNAIRHGGPSAQVRIAWRRDEGRYLFSVADRGPGVDPARLAGLFSPFEQLHGLRAAGLGLSIVHRLVAMQGGTSGYEKLPESGARFYFTLPEP